MTIYISDPIAVDRASIKQEIIDAMQTSMPGLDAAPGTPADFLADIFAQFHAEALQTFTQQLAISFRYGFEKIDRIPQRTGVQATASGTLTRTASDTAIRIVDAGTEFNIEGADCTPVAFQTIADATFPLSTATVAVDLIAVLPGTGGNGLTTVLSPAQALAWYASLTLTAATSGGEDPESDDEYLNRAADTRPGRAFTIVQPDDLARFLRNQPSVDRALVIDNYDPGPPNASAGGHITAITIDAAGAELSGGVMSALQAAAQDSAVTGLAIHIIAPTANPITVVFAGKARAGFDPADVETRAEQAVLDFLARSRWGLPDSGDERDWIDTPIVRYQDIVTVLNNVQGFSHYTSLTINGGTADVTMTGPGALPASNSTASGTVTL